jgi:hypothetical protein
VTCRLIVMTRLFHGRVQCLPRGAVREPRPLRGNVAVGRTTSNVNRRPPTERLSAQRKSIDGRVTCRCEEADETKTEVFLFAMNKIRGARCSSSRCSLCQRHHGEANVAGCPFDPLQDDVFAALDEQTDWPVTVPNNRQRNGSLRTRSRSNCSPGCNGTECFTGRACRPSSSYS